MNSSSNHYMICYLLVTAASEIIRRHWRSLSKSLGAVNGIEVRCRRSSLDPAPQREEEEDASQLGVLELDAYYMMITDNREAVKISASHESSLATNLHVAKLHLL